MQLSPLGWVPLAAAGQLRYGGRLHALLAGTVYAGSGRSQGLCTSPGGEPCSCSGAGWAELYYADPVDYGSLASRLRVLGLEQGEAVFRHAGVEVRAVAPVAGPCRGGGEPRPRGPVRLLVALPPLSPPPAAPMASHRGRVEDLEPCSGSRLFCGGEGSEAVLVDIVAPLESVAAWAEGLGGVLAEAVARLEPLGLTALVYAPRARND